MTSPAPHPSTSDRPLGLAVLGLGEGRSILSAAQESPLWSVARLCDLNADLGANRCREFGIGAERFTTDWRATLADPAVDVVGIYTPDHLHAEHVIAALQAGKHVICTKPFLDNLGSAPAVLAAVQASGRRVLVGQSTRFFAPFQRQREHFETGAFGALSTLEAAYHADHRWFLEKPWAREARFKWLYGALSHPVDLARWYLPEIDEVFGYADLSANGKAGGLVHPDTFHYVLRTRDGRIARVSGSYSNPVVPAQRDSGMTCILRCDLGASQADYQELRYAYKLGGRSMIERFDGEEDYYFRFEGNTHHAGEYQNYIEHFARCLKEGTNPRPDAAEGVVTLAVLSAMEHATASGRPVRVGDILAKHGLAHLAER